MHCNLGHFIRLFVIPIGTVALCIQSIDTINQLTEKNSFATTSNDNVYESLIKIADFLRNVTFNITKLPMETEHRILNLTKLLINAFDELSGKILRANDSFFEYFHRILHKQLEQIKEELFNLAENMEKQIDWAITQLNESLITESEAIELWTANIKYELRAFNDNTSYKKACKVIDNFVLRSTHRLHSCCNITITPLHSLCNNARFFLTKALSILANLIERIQKCLDDKKSYTEFSIPCIYLVYEEIGSIVSKALHFKSQFSGTFPVKVLLSDWCFLIVLENIERHKREITLNYLN